MSARSSLLSLVALAACRKPPEADPAKVVELATQILQHVPAPGVAGECDRNELAGVTMTQPTLRRIGHQSVADDPAHADWINPSELDSPSARVLADPKADPTAQRRAAAEWLAAPAYVIYRIESVNAPIALGVKDLKRGTVSGRALRYDKTGRATCVLLFAFQDDEAKSEWAIAKSDKAIIDPVVSQAMRDHLHAQYLANYPRPTK
jgi:hypothetical protein